MKLPNVFRLVFPSARTLRLSTYLLVVGLGIGTLSSRALYAQVREAAFSFGRELVGLAELTRGAEVILINGERFHHSIVVTTNSVSRVLDHVQAYCETSLGLLGQASGELDQLQHTRAGLRGAHGAPRRDVIRDQAEDRGMVICFVDGRVSGLSALSTALERFLKTRNLSDFGRLRYSFAERRKDGKTRVVTLWADTGLNLSTMFPTEGDAAGTDSPILPRPAQARRLLSAAAAGMPFGLRLYRSEQPVRDVEQYYDQWMKERGWQTAAKAKPEGTTAYLRSDDYQAFLTVLRQTDGTYITLTESGRADGSSLAKVRVEEQPGGK